MHSNEFEKSFDNFIDQKEYDQAETALFSLVRAAFLAGWIAAGGEKPTPHKMFELLPPQSKNH